MSIEEQYVALPKLYGAPAYARPTGHRPRRPAPFDPDELPIEAAMTEEDREIAESLPALERAPTTTRRTVTARRSRRGRSASAASPGAILKQDEGRV